MRQSGGENISSMSVSLGGTNVEIDIRNDDGGAIAVGISGRLDANSSPSLQQAFDEMGESLQKTNLTLDLSELEYISSAGLRVLLILQKKMAAAQGSLTVKNIQGPVREVLDMTGFSALLKIV
jgi:anti-anti-sigma factor